MMIDQAISGLGLGRSDILAAWAMQRVNRHARSLPYSTKKRYIYHLKDLYLAHLCRAGFCQSARQVVFNHPCWRCNGTGDYWDTADCHKCAGTGIYSRSRSVEFVFLIDGLRFVWHCPFGRVSWPVVYSGYDEQTTDQRRSDAGDYQPASIVQEDAWVVWWYLILAGSSAPSPINALHCDVPGLRRRLFYSIRRNWRRMITSDNAND